jgi:hypothetical protein
MSKILDRVLAAELKTEDLFVPQWNETVRVREFNAGERVDFAADVAKNPRLASVRACIACVSDPSDGKPVFEKAHQDMLLTKSAAAVELIGEKILRLSGMLKDSADELEKNSQASA